MTGVEKKCIRLAIDSVGMYRVCYQRITGYSYRLVSSFKRKEVLKQRWRKKRKERKEGKKGRIERKKERKRY